MKILVCGIGKKNDDLFAINQLYRSPGRGIPLQFENMED